MACEHTRSFQTQKYLQRAVRNACTKHYELLVEYQFLLSSWGYSVHPADMTDDALSWGWAECERKEIQLECDFGRLKGRWHSLLKRNDVKIDLMTSFVTACCILHNICEVHQDSFNDQWLG